MNALSPKLEELERAWRKKATQHFRRSKLLAKAGSVEPAARDHVYYLAIRQCADDLHRFIEREFPMTSLSHPWRRPIKSNPKVAPAVAEPEPPLNPADHPTP
jgi:hypothetical protein